MNPHSMSNAAGLILAPFFLISAMQFGRWILGCLTGWLT
jgi:hypothetical protein